MSQRGRAVGNTMFDLTGPRFEPQTSRSRDERATARPTGNRANQKQAIIVYYRAISINGNILKINQDFHRQNKIGRKRQNISDKMQFAFSTPCSASLGKTETCRVILLIDLYTVKTCHKPSFSLFRK